MLPYVLRLDIVGALNFGRTGHGWTLEHHFDGRVYETANDFWVPLNHQPGIMTPHVLVRIAVAVCVCVCHSLFVDVVLFALPSATVQEPQGFFARMERAALAADAQKVVAKGDLAHSEPSPM